MADDQDALPMILPRSAWESPTAHLRALFRAKKALDKLEHVDTNQKTPPPDTSNSPQAQ